VRSVKSFFGCLKHFSSFGTNTGGIRTRIYCSWVDRMTIASCSPGLVCKVHESGVKGQFLQHRVTRGDQGLPSPLRDNFKPRGQSFFPLGIKLHPYGRNKNWLLNTHEAIFTVAICMRCVSTLLYRFCTFSWICAIRSLQIIQSSYLVDWFWLFST
jgi:hypothetical protein